MKPIIMLTGLPQSYTSMVSKFLLDNGGFSNDLMGDPNEVLPYERFESKNLEDYIKQRKWFKNPDLSSFFDALPEDRVVTLKMPFIIQFINDLPKYTNRKIKVVFIVRNPQDTILSSMKKSGRSFIYFFERMVWYHNFVANCKLPVYMLIAEHILIQNESTAKALLDFCELKSTDINFSGIDQTKIQLREPTYVRYRFANFFWKKLSFLFRVYKI
ncbi:MAG: sulfotransferase domain-containing protein [Bacteroidetes bacterium]|nr:sulfotransferase domain-containing protein [Bacteroidota bacterium]